jgi:uncharacterized UBP type Zn finger protein
MSDKPKTAVQWLKMKVAYNRILTPEDIEKALAMEREQIANSVQWCLNGVMDDGSALIEGYKYYTDTYGE